MKIGIATPCVTPADAVSNDVLGMGRALADVGHEVRLFADSWGAVEGRVRHISEARAFLKGSDSMFIYHFSVGWDDGLSLLSRVDCPTVIKYHNITPPGYFSGVDEISEHVCRVGRAQLGVLAGQEHDLYMADSEFNLRELLDEGVPPGDGAVVPPFHHIDRLNLIEADIDVLKAFGDGSTNILTVGRVVPNKGHRALIDAFAAYHYEFDPNSRLLIVGKQDHRLSSYHASLYSRIEALDLTGQVHFAGEVSDNALKAYYEVAQVFMMTSEHEGFCVPLVESMAMGIPIVTIESTAIPGTVGRAGLVWPEPNSDLLAQSIDVIRRDESVRKGLSSIGYKRYRKRFSNEVIKADLLASIDRLVRPIPVR